MNKGFLKAFLCLQLIITSVILVINRLWADITKFFFVPNFVVKLVELDKFSYLKKEKLN